MIPDEATHLASFPRTQPRVCGAFLFRSAGHFVLSGPSELESSQMSVMGQKRTSRPASRMSAPLLFVTSHTGFDPWRIRRYTYAWQGESSFHAGLGGHCCWLYS